MTAENQAAVLQIYGPDLPDPAFFDAEVKRRKLKWADVKEDVMSSSVTEVLNHVSQEVFPNIITILCILLVIPVTTARVPTQLGASSKLT